MAYKPISIEELKDKTLTLFRKYGLVKVAVFGSCSRNEMKLGSNIDLLIQLPDLNIPLVFVELQRKLENRLKRKIDLISYSSMLSSDLYENIAEGIKVIYERH